MSSIEISMEQIKQAIEGCRTPHPGNTPDVYVMTTEAYWVIKQEIAVSTPVTLGFGDMLTFFGVPVEHYPTLLEASKRCLDLQSMGKHSLLVYC